MKKRNSLHDRIIGVLALTGAGVMGYLIRLHYLHSGSSICDISESFSCGIVNKSQFSEIFGIPIAILGLVYFLTILYILILKPLRRTYTLILLFSIFSLGFGIYLSVIEYFVLDSICLFCELSKLIMIGLIFASIHAAKIHREKIPSSWILSAIATTGIFSWVSWILQK